MAAGRESYTSLYGGELVRKDHVVIQFRGALDAATALTICVCAQAREQGQTQAEEALGEITGLLCGIMRAHVRGEPVQAFTLMGLNDEGLRRCSHHPDKYFGVAHFLPDASMGSLMAQINYLRTQVRGVERLAVTAFGEGAEREREDIIRALNRLSSAVYILMCRLNAGFNK